jgi:hypothetical protein
MKTYIMLEHIDYKTDNTVLCSNKEEKLNLLACKLNKIIRDIEEAEDWDRELELEAQGVEMFFSFTRWIDRYVVKEIETI